MPMEGDPVGDGEGGFRTGTDAFSFALGYYEGDYKPINPSVTISDSRDDLWSGYQDIRNTTEAKGLYNGNISWMSTDLPSLGESNRMQAMVYGYDQLHRIVQAKSLTYEEGSYDEWTEGSHKYDVDYSYDPNEDRPLRKCPVDIFREGPGCRAGLT